MRAVVRGTTGELILNYMWLPTFIGVDVNAKRKLEERVAPTLLGRAFTEELLQEAHELVVQELVLMYPALQGLRDYLDAMKFVQEGP